MMCPDCRQLRHSGPCDPIYDEPDDLELLAIDAALAAERLQEAITKRAAEGRSATGVNR